MKKSLLLFVAMVTGMVANAQYENAKQVFNSPKLQEAVKTHKLVAILPFEVKMTYKKQPLFSPASTPFYCAKHRSIR